jgi:hypothetical protein
MTLEPTPELTLHRCHRVEALNAVGENAFAGTYA